MPRTKNTRIVEVEIPRPEPVRKGNVFSTAVEEMVALFQEVRARRVFDQHAAQFLKSKGLLEEFEKYRKEVPVTGRSGGSNNRTE